VVKVILDYYVIVEHWWNRRGHFTR